MTNDQATEHLRKAVMLLDCALPHFERAAQRERERNTHTTGLRQITDQERLKAVREMIEDVGPTVGYEA